MKVIITGATGMVGEGVLLECLSLPEITEVLSVNRKPIGITHPKLKEYIVSDFLSIQENDENLQGYDACFYCAGVSSLTVKEPDYTRITYDTTLKFAQALGPKEKMSFIYVSGMGTNNKENAKGWVKVKGKTESDIFKMPFKHAFAFRPGLMKSVPGQKNISYKWYKLSDWLFPVTKFFGIANTLQQVAHAMIYVSKHGYETNVIEVKDISRISELKL